MHWLVAMVWVQNFRPDCEVAHAQVDVDVLKTAQLSTRLTRRMPVMVQPEAQTPFWQVWPEMGHYRTYSVVSWGPATC